MIAGYLVVILSVPTIVNISPVVIIADVVVVKVRQPTGRLRGLIRVPAIVAYKAAKPQTVRIIERDGANISHKWSQMVTNGIITAQYGSDIDHKRSQS